jgi:hypothetical protein
METEHKKEVEETESSYKEKLKMLKEQSVQAYDDAMQCNIPLRYDHFLNGGRMGNYVLHSSICLPWRQ